MYVRTGVHSYCIYCYSGMSEKGTVYKSHLYKGHCEIAQTHTQLHPKKYLLISDKMARFYLFLLPSIKNFFSHGVIFLLPCIYNNLFMT